MFQYQSSPSKMSHVTSRSVRSTMTKDVKREKSLKRGGDTIDVK